MRGPAAPLPRALAAGGLLPDRRADGWWRFGSPLEVLAAPTAKDAPGILAAVERAAAAGRWAVGWVAYEAAPGFDPAFPELPAEPGVDAAWFALFGPPRPAAKPGAAGRPGLALELTSSLDRAGHRRGVEAVRRHIAAGNVYQANLTYRLLGELSAAGGDPAAALFARLTAAQETPYALAIDRGADAVCSASPELFFERLPAAGGGWRLESRPMKGTAARRPAPADDQRAAAALAASAKERAENLMIVDMVRNDLGRVATAGSVEVTELFRIERYPTVWQMTSTVAAASRASLVELFAALFPAASITGAPKVRAVELLAGLETTPRGLYTGALGVVAPGGAARFAVGIRTAHLVRPRGASGATTAAAGAPARLVYGTGGGIVWDSEPAAEWAESRAKCRVLVRPPRPDFRLLETLLWCPRSGFFLLDRHLERLAASADYFGWSVDPRAIRRELEEVGRRLAAGSRGEGGGEEKGRRKVRLTVGRDGDAAVTEAPLGRRRRWRVAVADEPVDPSEVWLYHKTTHREIYRRALAAAPAGVDDVLLWNEAGELTEATRANLVVRRGRELATPPVASGLLAGTLRAELLARGRLVERRLRRRDLARADGVYLLNSVRGWIPIVGAAPPSGRETLSPPGRSRPDLAGRSAPPTR